MNTQSASLVTRWIAGRWHRGPRIHIAPTARHLPFRVPDDVRGLRCGDDVHLVAAQPVDSLAQTLAHEAVGHFGLQQLLGKNWPHFMSDVLDGLRSGDARLLSHQRHIRNVYANEKGEYLLSARDEADEIAAYLAEDLVCFRTGTIRPAEPLAQAFEAAKGRILRDGLGLDRPVSRRELEGTLYLAAKHMEGWPWHPARQRIRRFWRGCCNMLGMSKRDLYERPMSWDESKALLRKEEERLRAKDEREGFWSLLTGLVGFLVLGLGGVALILFGLFSGFGR